MTTHSSEPLTIGDRTFDSRLLVGGRRRMKIIANETELEPDCSLPAFLESIGHQIGLVVVERNREALSPSEAGDTILQDGDSLEIVKIVAGG